MQGRPGSYTTNIMLSCREYDNSIILEEQPLAQLGHDRLLAIRAYQQGGSGRVQKINRSCDPQMLVRVPGRLWEEP